MTITNLLSPPAPFARARRSVMLDDTLLERFRNRPLVVLSPHFDDACFSLGVFLSRARHGDLVNIFTQGDFFAHRSFAMPDRATVFAVRDSEDAAFAEFCGLRRHDLGCEEPSLRGRRPSQLGFQEDDVGQIASPVMIKLDNLAAAFPPGRRGVLMAPLGIGRHVNHRAVAAVIQRFVPFLEARYEILFYEDLPYAGNGLARLTALRRAQHRIALKTRHVLPTKWGEKKALVEFYPSQLRNPARPGDYWPMAASPWTPHEAFWSIYPTGHVP